MDIALLVLRVLVGLTLAAHGSQKLFGVLGGGGPHGTRKFFAGLGFRAPLLMALAAGLSEFGGGLLFALGLATPLAALALTVVMLNAIGTVHWRKGYFNSAGGYEYNVLIIATALAVTAGGPGRFSLDHALGLTGISGQIWALAVVAVAVLVALATLTLGRHAHTQPPDEASATPLKTKAQSRASSTKGRHWTSA